MRPARGSGLRIATVYKRLPLRDLPPTKMSTIRWFRMSEALARRGHRVDIVVDDATPASLRHPRLRYVSYADVDWRRYDVVKTLFHSGFDALREAGGEDHPFIISKLGSVVGPRDDTEGVYFFGQERERLFATQLRIRSASRWITVLTEPSARLWSGELGAEHKLLFVPTGVDRALPPARRNPYGGLRDRVAIYAGNIYGPTQPEMNAEWQARLTDLGGRLRRRGIRLFFLGTGTTDRMDPWAVTVLGAVPNGRVWDYQRFADVGVVLAQGRVQHNESSKIYYYLRTGLPVVSEEPVPNNHLLERTGMGLVAGYGDPSLLADLVEEAARRSWPRREAMREMVRHHSWDARARVYDAVLREDLCRMAG